MINTKPSKRIADKSTTASGVWTYLAVHSNTSVSSARPIYRQLLRRIKVNPDQQSSEPIFERLMRRVDPAQYMPLRIEQVAVEVISEGGHEYTVLRSPNGNYLRLNPAEAEIWQAMDGTRTVAALATLGFLRFGALLPVADLVQELHRQGFLVDAPSGLYQGLRSRINARSVESIGQRILSTLRGHEFTLPGIDTISTRLYRWGGKLLFTPWFFGLHAIICLFGLVCFFLLLSQGQNRILEAQSAAGDLIALWAALLVSFVLHEFAHALTVKHFGRHVTRGGLMIYYGMPAAFVDTSDIWMAGRRARILVSLAGPLCDLFVGSLGALIAWRLQDHWLGTAAMRLATACYLAALFNFNPLLELDGYYMLSDGLRLPNLRRRALDFISGPLWQKLRVRAELNPEERIFALYGTLAAIYTAIAVVLAGVFWQEQLVGVLGDLWDGGVGGRILALLIVLAVLVPVGLGILAAAWGLLRAAAAWVAQRGYGRSPLVVAVLLGTLAIALAGLPLRYGLNVETALIAPILWMTALAAQLALHRDYNGAAIRRALDSFLVVTILELIALGGLLLWQDQAAFWSGLQHIGFSLLLFAGFVVLLDIDLHRSRPEEFALSAILFGVAFFAGGAAILLIQRAHPEWTALVQIIAALPIYAGIVALALLLPLLTSLRDSRLRWSWLLLSAGITGQMLSYLLELLPNWRNSPLAISMFVLSSGLWCAAWCSHYVALRQIHPRSLNWPLIPSLAESERLQRAFTHSYAGLYRILYDYAGTRRARLLDDRMDVLAATANWDITLERDEARISPLVLQMPIDAQGVRYAEVLRYTVREMQALAGETFARRAILATYDALPWPEREAGNRYTFVHTPWAATLSQAFGDVHAARQHLLRQVELFVGCDDHEIHEIAVAMQPRHIQAGRRILQAGEQAPGVWIIEAGEVIARDPGGTLRELHRGDYFGDLGNTQHSDAAYYASIDSDVLFLPSSELQRLIQSTAPHTADAIALVEIVGRLERIPLFRDLPRATLRSLANHAQRRSIATRDVLIREGRRGGMFYVVEHGRAAVVRRNAETGKQQVIAQIGPSEFFGELELLHDKPPMASVVAISNMQVISIPHTAISAVLTGSHELARGLEQIGSGRILALRRT